MRRLYFVIAMLIAATSQSGAATPIMETRLSPPETPYHLSARYTVIVEGPASLICDFPDIHDEMRQIELRPLPLERETLDNERIRYVQSYVFDPVFPGMYMLPQVSVTWHDDENEGTLSAPAIAYHARELSDSEIEAVGHFMGIATPGALLPPRGFTRTHALMVVAAFLAAATLFVLYIRYRRGETPLAIPEAPPWETALKRLRELQRRDLPGAGKIDAFYVDLTSILRYYIEDRFHIHAPGQTTPEFLDAAARQRVFSDAQQAFLTEFLRECDRVKFARLLPGLDDMAAHFSQVKRFVQDTVPTAEESASMEQAA